MRAQSWLTSLLAVTLILSSGIALGNSPAKKPATKATEGPSVAFHAVIPNGSNATAYNDKTYTFSYQPTSPPYSPASIGWVEESADGTLSTEHFAPIQSPTSQITILVDVTDGKGPSSSSATKLGDSPSITGKWQSTQSYELANIQTLTVAFDPANSPSAWVRVGA